LFKDGVIVAAAEEERFTRTEMDTLILGNFMLLKEEQPEWMEPKGCIDEYQEVKVSLDPELSKTLMGLFETQFLPAVHEAKKAGLVSLVKPFKEESSTFLPGPAFDNPKTFFEFPKELEDPDCSPTTVAASITACWYNQELGKRMTPVLASLLELAEKSGDNLASEEEVSESMYVLF